MISTMMNELIVSFDKKKKKSSFCLSPINLPTELLPDEVLVKSHYSSINYKDMLSCLGDPAITRKYPHRPGSDLAGIVIKSNNSNFKTGDAVYTCTFPLGTTIRGTIADFVQIDGSLLGKIPQDISAKYVMQLGTAGFTAGYSIQKALELIELRHKRILISGADTSTGLYIALILNSMGFTPSIIIKRSTSHWALDRISYSEILYTEDFAETNYFALQRERFDVIFDLLGGSVLPKILAFIHSHGICISIGNILGSNCHISLLPFFQRGASLVGINSESYPVEKRPVVWAFVKEHITEKDLDTLTYKIDFVDVPVYLERRLNKQVVPSGRVFIRF